MRHYHGFPRANYHYLATSYDRQCVCTEVILWTLTAIVVAAVIANAIHWYRKCSQ
jgi:hypothetical protein